MSCRCGKLLFISRVFVTTRSERRLGLHSRGFVSNRAKCLGVILLLVANALTAGSKVGWVGRSFVQFILSEHRVSILVYSFLSNSILVTLVSDISSEGTGCSFSFGSVMRVFTCLVVLQ